MVDINRMHVCSVGRIRCLTPEEPDRWNTERDRKNVTPSRSGLSAPVTKWYDSVATNSRLHADLNHGLLPSALYTPSPSGPQVSVRLQDPGPDEQV